MAKQDQKQDQKVVPIQKKGTKSEVKLTQQQLKQRAQECVGKINEALTRVENGYFDCCRLLYEAMTEKYWIPLGYNEWDFFVLDKFGMKPRTADYHVGIQKAIIECGLTEKQLKNIGWSKMAAIYKILSKENVKEWLDKARTTSLRDLIGVVKLYKHNQKDDSGDTDTSPPVLVKLTVSLPEDKMVFVSNALSSACQLLGSENKGAAICHIATEWMEARGVSPEAIDFEQWKKFLEEKYPVAISYEVMEEEESEDDPDSPDEDADNDSDEEPEEEPEEDEDEPEEDDDATPEEDDGEGDDEGDDDLDALLGGDDENEEEQEEEPVKKPEKKEKEPKKEGKKPKNKKNKKKK